MHFGCMCARRKTLAPLAVVQHNGDHPCSAETPRRTLAVNAAHKPMAFLRKKHKGAAKTEEKRKTKE